MNKKHTVRNKKAHVPHRTNKAHPPTKYPPDDLLGETIKEIALKSIRVTVSLKPHDAEKFDALHKNIARETGLQITQAALATSLILKALA